MSVVATKLGNSQEQYQHLSCAYFHEPSNTCYASMSEGRVYVMEPIAPFTIVSALDIGEALMSFTPYHEHQGKYLLGCGNRGTFFLFDTTTHNVVAKRMKEIGDKFEDIIEIVKLSTGHEYALLSKTGLFFFSFHYSHRGNRFFPIFTFSQDESYFVESVCKGFYEY